jgi:predicted membrane-bound mannosyltransferase
MNVDSKLNQIMGILAAIGMGVVSFAGYTYVQNQDLQRHQLESAQVALSAIHQTASEASDETVRKLGVTPSPSQ